MLRHDHARLPESKIMPRREDQSDPNMAIPDRRDFMYAVPVWLDRDLAMKTGATEKKNTATRATQKTVGKGAT